MPEQTPSDAHLTLITLGDASLIATAGPELPASESQPLLGPGKSLALITYLHLTPGHSASRDTLVALLWSDVEPERAKHALRQTIWQLRQTLGTDALVGKDELRLACPLRSDREAFLAALEQGDLDLAVSLYKGPFLPTFASPGGAAFEQWADLERDQLRGLFLRCSETLVYRRLASSQVREAQRLARRARDEGGRSELGWRLLLESLVAARDFVSGGAEADALEQWAARERLTLEPATRAALRVARQVQAFEQPGEPRFVAELIGREREFALIVSAWEEARRGPARRLRVEAAAGLGKTRLLGDVEARLRASGARVASVRANMGERRIPFGFASELARSLATLPGAIGISPDSAATLVGLNPTLSSLYRVSADRATGPEALRRRTLALSEVLTVVAEDTPFALFIDDGHWMDAESRQIFDALESRLDDATVLLVMAERPRRDGQSGQPDRILELAPLTPHQVDEFVRSLGDLPNDEPWVAPLGPGLHSAGDGSPLLLLETLRLAIDRGVLDLTDSRWACRDPDALSAMLQAGEGIRARLGRLTREDRWIMTVLAVAGTPLDSLLLVRLAERSAPEVDQALTNLEHLGLVHRVGDGVEVTHDAIAEAAIEVALPEARRAADRALGILLMSQAGPGAATWLRAAQHFRAADAKPELARLFRAYLIRARRAQDYRPADQLAAEVLGVGATADETVALVSDLPFHLRAGPWSRRRIAVMVAAILIAIAVPLVSWISQLGPEPDAEMFLWRTSDRDGIEYATIPVHTDRWRQVSAVVAPDRWRRINDTLLAGTFDIQLGPSGTDFVFSRTTGNITTTDVFLRNRTGVRRLTAEPRDDGGASLSPDGKWVTLLTARWSAIGADDYDVAIMDTAGHRLRALTHGPDFEQTVKFSPDGTRLALGRFGRARASWQVCWVTFDGAIERCRSGPRDRFELVGWLDLNTVLLETLDGDDRELLTFSLEDGATQRIYRSRIAATSLSPDGRWLAAYGSETADEPPTWRVLPINDPATVRPIRAVKAGGSFHLTWSLKPGPAQYLDTLTILGASQIAVDDRHRLLAIGKSATGERIRIPPEVVRWSSSDTTIAAVDSISGEVRPRRLGKATILASAGGWRTASVSLTVVAAKSVAQLRETWDSLASLVWRPFGSPRPRVDLGPDGIRGLVNGGDGSYQSGVYSQVEFSATDGLGLETAMSTPVSREQWQRLNVALISARTFDLTGWDHVTGTAARIDAYEGESCEFTFPGGDGRGMMSTGMATGALTSNVVPLGSDFQTGHWYQVRIQIFPDGRCGIAVDGKPRWLSRATVPTSQPYRIWLAGSSVGTRMLVGPLELWQGVRRDLDWSVLTTKPPGVR